MKITRSQLHSIIKEELEKVMDEDRRLPDTDYELYGQLLTLTKELVLLFITEYTTYLKWIGLVTVKSWIMSAEKLDTIEFQNQKAKI